MKKEHTTRLPGRPLDPKRKLGPRCHVCGTSTIYVGDPNRRLPTCWCENCGCLLEGTEWNVPVKAI